MTIGIVGILASIAVPQFTEFRRKAYDAATISDIINASRAMVNRTIDEDAPSATCTTRSGCLSTFGGDGLVLSESTTNFSIAINVGGSELTAGGGYQIYGASCKGTMRTDTKPFTYALVPGTYGGLRAANYPFSLNGHEHQAVHQTCP